MPWTLKIIHIDVGAAGDSTLIIADDGTHKQAALIDGGSLGYSPRVHNRITANGITALDVMVATHYDADHCNGLRDLLKGGDAIYDNTRIYDQGEQGQVVITSKQRLGENKKYSDPKFYRSDGVYSEYVKAIEKKVTRNRVTAKVCRNFDELDDNMLKNGWESPDWLVGQEILWGGTAWPTPNPPTLTCIAANQYILQNNNPTRLVTASTLTGDNLKNAKSLAFLLQFGNFKYYIGGDITALQEDGSDWNNATNNHTDRPYSLMQYLTRGNSRVLAMKASHHGSKYSSSPAFLTQLKARAAFISCGHSNQHGHPDQEVVDALEDDDTMEWYFLTGPPGATASKPAATLGPRALVAGLPGSTVYTGFITLIITADESTAAPITFRVRFKGNRKATFRYPTWTVTSTVPGSINVYF